ncbi:MAG: sensor histidine kinase [Oscillospiraceae bacterium]|nr:sensor histidine kinase [Oscillospiraceae bacterium]
MKKSGVRMSSLLLLSILTIVILVLVSAVLLFSRTYQQQLILTARTNSLRTVTQVSSTVNEYLSEISTVMQTLEEELSDAEEQRSDFFDVFLRIRPDVVAVSTYDAAGRLSHCYSSLGEPTGALSDSVNLSLDMERLRSEPEGYVSAPHVVTFFPDVYPWVITTVSQIERGTGERWIALDISCSNIANYISDSGIGRRGYCYLMDTDGNIVYHPQQQLIYSELKSEDTALTAALEDGSHVEGNVIYAIRTLSNGQWRLVGVSFLQEVLTESLRQLGTVLLLLAGLVLLAALVVSVVLSATLSHPLRDLESAMEAFEADADGFRYAPPRSGVREVRHLSASFHELVLKVQQLMKTVRDEEINLRKTELRALQAQINPHFLYNTLDSISWMCEQGKNAEAVEMVNALARLFRISISRGHELIPIRSELQHAESYLEIQAHRYKNQFTWAIDAEEPCLDYLCHKITLQPIIENAIYHGINGLVDDGEIRVSVREEGNDILFTVEDNGSGMTDEQIAAIMQKEQSDRAGIGIKNVNDRLQIYFGSAYGIRIESRPDEGTTVSIRMPKVQKEAEYEKK